MRVRKTLEHGGTTLAHGSFRVREAETVCASGCIEEADDGKSHGLVRRPAQVASLLVPRSTVGYDVMAHVGIERFVRYRQREEIRSDLVTRFGIELSAGEVSALQSRFCVYLKALHEKRAESLRAALAADGGWPMHLDATGEDGQGTLLCIYAGWRGWVLGAWKIPTERADSILPRMTETARLFGSPCAVMRDLGRAVIEASRDFIAQLPAPIPNLGCHMHFVRDVGKDLLGDSHEALRALFRRFEIVADLRTLVRDLRRRLGARVEPGRKQVEAWLEDDRAPLVVPDGEAGLSTVCALAHWTLDYADDGSDEGFPFDRPFYDLYRRCLRVCRATEAFLARARDDARVRKALGRLFGIVSKARAELPFGMQAQILATRARLLDELRGALRLKLKEDGRNTPPPQVLSPDLAARELRNIEAAVRDLTRSLRERRPSRGPAQDLRAAIDLLIDHLERHGPSLFGHLVALPESLGGGFRVVERTNVILESFFHRMKHGERRRSGRKTLTQDLEHLPPEAALAQNLHHADYVQTLCGTLADLPAAFATLDAGHRSRSLPARRAAVVVPAEPVTRSMTIPDRRLVRTDAMAARIRAAADSRSIRLV
jgi:hypothetical protein